MPASPPAPRAPGSPASIGQQPVGARREVPVVRHHHEGGLEVARQPREERRAAARRCAWSRLPDGSSARTTAGALASARATATRCCSPPESCVGRCEPARREPDRLEQRVGPRAAPRASAAPAISSGIITFSQRGELPQQVVELEDEPDPRGCGAPRAAPRSWRRTVAPVQQDLAAGRPVERAEQVQQRALPGAAGADDGHELARETLRSTPASTSIGEPSPPR